MYTPLSAINWGRVCRNMGLKFRKHLYQNQKHPIEIKNTPCFYVLGVRVEYILLLIMQVTIKFTHKHPSNCEKQGGL